MKALVLSAALAVASPQPQWSHARPPERYQGLGMAAVLFAPPEALWTLCGNPKDPPPPGSFILACTKSIKVDGKDVPVIIMPDPCRSPGQDYAERQCHENAHYFRQWKHETP